MPENRLTGAIDFYGSRLAWALWFGLTATVAALSTVSWGWGPLGPIFFGGIAGLALREILVRPLRIRITAEGILDKHNPPLAVGFISWEEILDVHPIPGRGLIELELRDPKAFCERLPLLARLSAKLWRLRGHGPAVIQTWGLAASKGEIVEVLEDGLDAHVLAAARQELTRSRGKLEAPQQTIGDYIPVAG